MQLQLERNILHIYTAGTSTNDQQWGEKKVKGDGDMPHKIWI